MMLATEKRLIDADAEIATVKENICKNCNSYNGVRCRACWVDSMIGFIDEAPTVDAVEVVRCKDCEFWNDGWFPECTMGKCKRGKPVLTEPHHYCSYGVRRPDIPVIIKDESFVVKEDG